MDLNPQQQARLLEFQQNFQGSQEEYDSGLAALYDSFKVENEQEKLLQKINEAKAKKANASADQQDALAEANQDGASNSVPVSLESFSKMSQPQKRRLSFNERQRLEKEKKDRELFSDYVLNPDQLDFDKQRIPDDLYWSDLIGGRSMFDPEGDDKLEQFSKLFYASKGLDYKKIKAAKEDGLRNDQMQKFIDSNLYETKRVQSDPFMMSGLALGMGTSGGGVPTSTLENFLVEDYVADQDTLDAYPELFDEYGALKFKSKEELRTFERDLREKNDAYAEITSSEWNREIEHELNMKFKAMLEDLKIEQEVVLDYISEKTKSVEANITERYRIPENTVTDENEDGTVDLADTIQALVGGFNTRIEDLNQELNDTAGIDIEGLKDFKPATQEQSDIVNSIVDRLNLVYEEAQPLNEGMSTLNSLVWATDAAYAGQEVSQTLLNYGDVSRIRGEYVDGKGSSIWNSLRKGKVSGELNDEFWRITYGITDLDDPEQLKEVSEKVALLTAKNNGILTSRVWEEYSNANTVSAKMEILSQEPVEIFLSLFGNSMSQFFETGDELFIPIVGAGAGIGAASGATAGGVGAVPGFLTGASYGLSTWQAITALNMEVGNAYQTVMVEKGLDLSNPEDVMAGLKDPEIIKEANEIGFKRGIPIALMNLVGAKATNAIVSKTALSSGGVRLATAGVTGFVVDPVFEGTGEALAQVFSGEGIKATEIMDEMIGGTAGTSSNFALKSARMSMFNEAGKQAIKLKNLDNMVKGNYTVNQVEKFVNRLVAKNKITKEDAAAIRENARVVDAVNNQIKNNSKSGKVKAGVKSRVADLIKTKETIEKQPGLAAAAAKSIKQINEEISNVTSNNALKTEDSFVTIKDYVSKQTRSLNAAIPFLKSLGIDADVEIIQINSIEDYNNLPSMFNKDEVIGTFEDGRTSAVVSPYVEGKKQFIVVNNENVKNNGAVNLVNQGSTDVAAVSVTHEVLHAVLDRSFSDTQIIDLGKKLDTYLNEQSAIDGNDGKNISVGVVDKIKNRLKVYGSYNQDGVFVPSKENPNYTEAMYASEVFTNLSDEMSIGNIQWKRQDTAFWQRVANDITDYLKYKLGMPDNIINAAEIQTGEQAFNFVKNFNKSFYNKQSLTKRQIKGISPSTIANEESDTSTEETEAANRKSTLPGDIKSNLDKFTGPAESRKYTSNALFRATEDFASAFNALENTDLLDGSIAGLPAVTQEYLNQNPEFIRDVKERIGERFLRNYDAGLNSLFGWLTGKNKSGKSIIELSAGDIQNRNKRRPGGTSIDQEVSEGSIGIKERLQADEDSTMSDLENKDLSVTAKAKPKVKTFAESISVSPKLSEEITNTVINTLDPENKSLPSVTQTELRKKLEQAFSKDLYKKIRPLLGRKIEDYKKFLNTNYKVLWDKIPQSAINKRFPELATIVNKRMGASQSNVAERNVKNIYAGNTLRIKSNLTKQDFVDYFSSDPKKTRSRKESLAQVIAVELAKDEVNNVMMDNPDLRNRWIGQQELMNNNLKENYVAMLSAAIGRATVDSQGLRYSQIVQTAEEIGISQDQLVNLLNDLSLDEIQDQQPIIYDSIIDSFNYWVENKVKIVGRINDGFVKVISKQFPSFIGKYNNALKEYVKNKEYNWSTDYTDLEGNKRKIYNSQRYNTWLDQTLQQIKYMPVEALEALKNLKNQKYNWLVKMHIKDNGSSRGGSPVGMVYNKNGTLVSEDRQKKVTPEEYAEGKRISKEVYKSKLDKAIDDAIKNNKATEETTAKWKKYDSNDIELGNKGAATMGHILSVYRNIANKPWGAQTKANVMSRVMGPKGKASLKSGLALMDAYHSSLNDWVNNEVKNGRNRSDAITSIFANMQMTTNAVYSARAYASFTSFYFVDGPQDINKKFEDYKGEHVQDSSSTTSSIFLSMLNNSFNDNIEEILNGYEQSAMLESDTKRIDDLGGRNSPLGNLRFLLDPKLGKQIFNLDGINKYQEVLNEYDQIFRTSVGANLRVDNTALKLRKSQGPRKGISVWDFDDTLATTKSMIGVEMPAEETMLDVGARRIFKKEFENRPSFKQNFKDLNKEQQARVLKDVPGRKSKIDAETFAKTSDKLAAEGAQFDFSEFNKVMKGKKGPMFEKALARNKKFGNENVYILTARPQASATAIQKFLKGIGLDIPLKNITGLADGRPEAKAAWIEDKVLEGYNDFYFADDVYKNVKAVQESLDKYDIKSKTEVAGFRNSMTNSEKFNTILEQVKGIPKDDQFSDARAKNIGKQKGKFKFFVPPSAEDFVGLLYGFLGKGKQGDAQMDFFKQTLIKPFSQAMQALSIAKNASRKKYRSIRKSFSKKFRKSLLKESEYSGFSNEDAARVYMWRKGGYDIPGLSKQDINKLVEVVENNEELKSYADQIFNSTGKGYVEPSENWTASGIAGDLRTSLDDVNRKQYLGEWIKNKNEIFSKENLNKIEAAMGSNFREALEDILYRMENGSNRNFGSNRLVNGFMNWINNSVGTIMFFNARSAVLQTISAVNFINLTDNNPIAVAKTLINQKQFWTDFVSIFNSDFLQQRRAGNTTDVSASEIASYVKNSKNPIKAGIAFLLEKGFIPTQIADSFAISIGGASFYRNRINTYVNQGFSLEEAQTKAFGEFQELAELSQQSSRADRISQQQSGPLGRVILAFANTPMQYTRLIKKATLDLANRRGDWKTNLSKIVYYGAIQNYIFNALQNALFAQLWDDDEEEEEKKNIRIASGMSDSLLRGMGIGGAGVAAIKNIVLRVIEESKKRNPEYTKASIDALSLSPPVQSKIRKIASAGNILKYEGDEIFKKGLSIDNPAFMITAKLASALGNIPADRLLQKLDNLRVAIDEDTKWWQTVALTLGWDQWSLGLGRKNKDKVIVPKMDNLKIKGLNFKKPKFKKIKF